MNANMSCLISIFTIIFIYALIAVAILKFDFNANYRTWNRKDKFVSIGMIIIFIIIMFLKACRMEGLLTSEKVVSLQWNQLLLQIFNDDIPMVFSAIFTITVIPSIVSAATAMDTLGKKYRTLSLPLYFYILLFGINSKFYSVSLSNTVTVILLVVLNHGVDVFTVIFYIVLWIENILAAFVINRAYILRKIWWMLICLLSYIGLFLLHLYVA